MNRVLVLFLVMSFLQTGSAAQEREPVRFDYVDVYLDSNKKDLAAYQLELTLKAGKVRIVGIECGEHPAFEEPPYYDPAALAKDRIVIAAFNTGRELPRGRTRVARLHVQIAGDVQPRYDVLLRAAAAADGKKIPVEISLEQHGEAK